METILTVILTLLVTALVLLAIPGLLFLIGLYKAARAGQHSTPDKLRWMADQLDGTITYEFEINGADLQATIQRRNELQRR